MYVNKHCHIFQFGNQKRGAKPVCFFFVICQFGLVWLVSGCVCLCESVG